MQTEEIEGEEHNSILSPELLEALGSGDVILPSKKKAKVRATIVSEEVLKEVRQISKKEQRKLDQLQMKKEKEEKRSHYMEVLKKSEISEKDRSLMLSTREIGQTQSTKKKLQMILKRQRAGLQLTEEESCLLYRPRKEAPTDNGNDPFSNTACDSQISTINNVVHNVTAVEEKKDILPLKPTVQSFAGLGSQLLAKFQRLKQLTDEGGSGGSSSIMTMPKTTTKVVMSGSKESVQSIRAAQLGSEIGDYNEEDEEDDDDVELFPVVASTSTSTGTVLVTRSQALDVLGEVPEGERYVPDEFRCPVTDMGVIRGTTGTSSSIETNSTSTSVMKRTESRAVDLKRDPQIQEIVEAINNNDVVIICGETGSGKSTQVPQFLYEAGYCTSGLIGITQPRRVAAVSTAQRVSQEMGSETCHADGLVGYQIRYDSRTVGSGTAVKFMTDGILLKE
eukprot:gene3828-7628_t